MNELAILLIGVALGGAITWFVAWLYYKRAGRELAREAAELRRLNALMLHGMEHAGWIKLSRDESGKILGFEQIIRPKGIKSAERFGTPTVLGGSLPADKASSEQHDPDEPQNQEQEERGRLSK